MTISFFDSLDSVKNIAYCQPLRLLLKSFPALWQKTDTLDFVKEHWKKPGENWEHIFWSDETKVNLFGSNGVRHVWSESGQNYNGECTVLTVKNRGGGLIIRGCMRAKGIEDMTVIDGPWMSVDD